MSSNWARKFAPEVAALASRGYITALHPQGGWCREWRLTVPGLGAMCQYGDVL